MEQKPTLLPWFVRRWGDSICSPTLDFRTDEMSSFPARFGPRILGRLLDYSRTYAKRSSQAKSGRIRMVCHSVGRLQLAYIHFPHQKSLLPFQAILLILHLSDHSVESSNAERDTIKIARCVSEVGKRLTLQITSTFGLICKFVCRQTMKETV